MKEKSKIDSPAPLSALPTLPLQDEMTISSTPYSATHADSGPYTKLWRPLRRSRKHKRKSDGDGGALPSPSNSEKISTWQSDSTKGWKLSGKRPGLFQRKADLAFIAFNLLGVILSGVILSMAWTRNPQQKLCLAFEDDFSGGEGLDLDKWSYEVRADGGGSNSFDMSTSHARNSFVEDGTLYLVPTLTSDEVGMDAITGNYVYNLSSSCTAEPKTAEACTSVANSTTGTMLRPITSARLRTRASIGYGRVEVRAKMPTGDWLWPTISLLPRDSVYGAWPRSGEIDIAKSKGNAVLSRSDRFVNSITSTLHWGTSIYTDRWGMTSSNHSVPRHFFSSHFTTYGLDWTPTSLTTWIDRPSRRILRVDLKRDMFKWAHFPKLLWNGTAVDDPWDGRLGAPFDQPFELSLNVAVGGTDGYFADADRDKPWQNAGYHPMADFWSARDKWFPTWPTDPRERGLAVKSVKMWQRC